MLIHCPSCNTEYDCAPGNYECECGAKFSVSADGSLFTDKQTSPQSPDKVPERTNIKKWGIPAAAIAVLLLIAGIIIFGNRVDIANALPDDFRTQMVRVEKGSFMMGNPEENNLHKVTLTHDYYIGRTEVTQALWKHIMGTNNSHNKGDKLPVENISWDEAREFCNRLNEMYAEKIPAGYRFDLPTEAQWEYAARGGSKSLGYRFSGSNDIDQVAWYDNNSGIKTHFVGTKQANELGIYDMSGNVVEMTRDKFENDCAKDPEFLKNNNGYGFTGRGGSYVMSDNEYVTDRRWLGRRDDKSWFLGFRLAFVYVPTENPKKKAQSKRIQEDIARGFCFSDDGKMLLEAPRSITDYIIPNEVTIIGERAFRNCDDLVNVTIPNSIVQIKAFSFSFCHSLTSITIPNGVKTIEQHTFSYSDSLTHITIPDSVDEIKEGAFKCCESLKSIAIPNKNVKIWEDAFEEAGCESQVKRDYSDRIVRKTNSQQ